MTPVWWLLGFIPALVLLYFLKLKRRDVPVSSTMLWRRSLEDLHVNSPFQRLRRSILFFLQLAILLLLIAAVWRPRWQTEAAGGREILVLIDTSASMNAREPEGRRLDLARGEARKIVESMEPRDRMMLLAFADRPSTVQPFTSDQPLLRSRIDSIAATSLPTDLARALATAHSLAHSLERPEIYLIGDGCYGDVSALPAEVKLLSFKYVARATRLDNLAITEADVRRTFGGEPRTEVFVLVENGSQEEARVTVSLYRESLLIDARELAVPAREERSALFDVTEQPPGMYRAEIGAGDALADDDRAFLDVAALREIEVLVAGRGNPWLDRALASIPNATIARLAPGDFAPGALDARLEVGTPVLVFDRWVPEEVPPAPAVFIGCLPPQREGEPAGGAAEPIRVERPIILDWSRSHPVNRFITYANIHIAKSYVFPPGPAYRSLVETDKGSVIGVLERSAPDGGSIPAICVGFDLLESNWPLGHFSFPIFFSSAVAYLGASPEAARSRWRTGEALVHRLRGGEARAGRLEFVTPSGRRRPATLERGGNAVLGEVSEAGIYEIQQDGQPLRRFGVSLLSSAESRLEPAASIDFGEFSVAARGGLETRPRDLWTWLALAALAVLLGEWYVYNRRVYV